MNNTNKICPLRLIAFTQHISILDFKDFDSACRCREHCAWYVKYNDEDKSCCAIVDIANVLD